MNFELPFPKSPVLFFFKTVSATALHSKFVYFKVQSSSFSLLKLPCFAGSNTLKAWTLNFFARKDAESGEKMISESEKMVISAERCFLKVKRCFQTVKRYFLKVKRYFLKVKRLV